MEEDFERLMKFFDESNEEKDKKLDVIFQEVMIFFERYKHVLKEGGESERALMKKKMERLREKLHQENQRNQEQLGLTTEEIKHLAKDPKHFSPEQWEYIQDAQNKIAKEKLEHSNLLKSRKEERQKQLKQKNKKKSSSRRSDWLKS